MSTMRPSIPRLSALLHKKPVPMLSPGPPLPPSILVDEEILPVLIPRTSTQRDPERFSPIVTKPWSRLAGTCLQQYGSRVNCKDKHIDEPESVVALKLLITMRVLLLMSMRLKSTSP
ncbi:conserved hypothetical protein [Aspergillus lentulus]|nr:conserved hypothetical protein [Aspergillus lentulus]